ncbi:G protein pathway suppressor 1 [Trametes versicolor FP-101664 SS1]|uniref:G protein pathway suppressor 1 n=1 Tax=Trametes versicolor (strain FP-101664) TaxID=717944 RepID=UPI0004623560|nr:G protein pathway suppressor 1 [Trametes versicolor FP-101664 SS1]EIW53311.1 G protein pathway suppressor 1 [Trametes versicolor FP-101664 SS1]
MDVDIIDNDSQEPPSYLTKSAGKRPLKVVVDESHPLELEAYLSSYSGRAHVDRVLHIMSVCPTLAPQALQLAITEALSGRDPNMYRSIFLGYERAHSEAPEEIPELSALATPDQQWLEETSAKNQAERTKLEVELKTYTSNMIKESIRMAHRDLGDFYRSTGEQNAALKHYTKSREFCTTSQHVLDMCMSVIELLMEQRNYSHIATYVFKAEAALDSASVARANTGPEAPAGSAQASKEKRNAEREKVQTKLDVAAALSHLGQSNYEKAAQTFLKAGPVKGLEEWAGKIIAPGDIAVYATLCALATFTRPAIRTQILDNDNFGMYIEQEPYVRELVESYMNNRFKSVLDILDRYSTRHYIDIHLSSHVLNLTNLIRSKALVLYFQPFSSIRLERMGQAFGWTIDEIEQQVVTLIQAGEIKARVDRQNKILKAKETDQRAALFAKAIKSGQDMQAVNRKLLLRMRLQQADLVVKPPKGQQQGLGQQQGHNYGGGGGSGFPSELLVGEY